MKIRKFQPQCLVKEDIISVYTTGQSFLGDGQAIVRHVCNTVASLLT